MKKYILTESQVKRVLDTLIKEQTSPEDKYAKQQQASFDAVYNNPTIKEQLAKKRYPAGTKFGFSPAMIEKLSNPKSPMLSHSNILYQVKPGDTVSGIAQKMGANSVDNILYDNDLLKGNPKAIQPGMVITFSLLPSGN
jgi:hypothetical protein